MSADELRAKVLDALAVTDVHHPDYCDCGQPLCGGTCYAEGEDCFCETERCDGIEEQADRVLALVREREAAALREAADYIDTRPNGSFVKGPVMDDYSGDLGYYGESQFLRDRADRIDGGAS